MANSPLTIAMASYFGARYYSPSLGRFLTPDWSSTPEPIPYANLENPQSLNLYSYVLNNPVSNTDPDGHICFFGIGHCGNDAPPKASAPRPPSGSLVFTPIGNFQTLDKAGIAAVKAINPQSIAKNLEYAGNIARTPSGDFGYLPPVPGTPIASRPPSTQAQPLEAGTTIAADYHTHAAFDPRMVTSKGDGNEIFSDGDKHTNIPGYLGTPKGAIKVYDPKTGVVRVLVPAGGGQQQ